ncbi:DEAD/DEAH box helicase family protein [Synechococcus sp. UW140]|uniref:DEAD/DEAH box helicase n=1 Tax=Synechococcus sp. UW140 TaxID=368503 RepID=UPI0025E7FEAC|nr:DEAD/DEAH box helicase family protein [Synechococcus sp. UW140]
MASPSFAISRLQSRPALGIRPRRWQQRLLELLRRRLQLAAPGVCTDVLIHAGPGAGKTLGSLHAFLQLRQGQQLQAICICCHRSSIANQWKIAAKRLGLDLGEGVLGPDGLICSYQAANRDPQQWRLLLQSQAPLQQWLLVADEVHHLGLDPLQPEEGGWGHSFEQLSSGAKLRLGLTGTPFRADQLQFCSSHQQLVKINGISQRIITPDLVITPQELINSGDVRPLRFHFQDGWIEYENKERSALSAEQRESWRARNLRRAVRLGDRSSIALQVLLQARKRREALQEQQPGAAGLVVARDISHARGISCLLEEEGDKVVLVHSQDPGAAEALSRFQGGEGEWLVSVDMCAEGFDAPRLRVVAYLTTVTTRSRFLQAITRAVRLDGSCSAIEPMPRHASYIHAPADPLLMAYARNWSLSSPYLLAPEGAEEISPEAALNSGNWRPEQRAISDAAGAVIEIKEPQLPGFLAA